MRIVHISDIHLSEQNFPEFENNYRHSLIKTLQNENKIKKIDIIVITGDLVDKGGSSLFNYPKFKDFTDPYDIFEKEFINPIKSSLGLYNYNFLFIPGNHDINEDEILWIDEKNLQDAEVEGKINILLAKNKSEFTNTNKRIQLFKNFERRFHDETPNYEPSNNESTYIYVNPEGVKVGFALINDSWRCSTCHLHKHKDKKLYFGEQQLYQALQTLEASATRCNIVLTHHPLSSYAEEELVKRTLIHKNYHLHLYGDKHTHTFSSYISATGDCWGIMARAALNKPDEPESKWQPGFHLIDIDFEQAVIERITYYKYIYHRCKFAKDTETADDGYDLSKRVLSFAPITKISKVKKDNLDKSKYCRL